MDYTKYVKGTYANMALKGIELPFEEKWESAAVGAQCLFRVNNEMNNSTMKLINAIPDSIMDKFAKGETIEFNAETKKYVELLLRVQNYLQAIVYVSDTYLPPLIQLVLENKDSVDIGIYKYFVGNRAVLEGYAAEAQKQANAIGASLNASFANNQSDIEEARQRLAETFAKTRTDLNAILNKLVTALKLNGLIKVIE